ncbi:hypothetical protein LN42_00635 [Marinitoga sp. 1137]|uniref:hypothetical protein n=1 Tax=Marinitoga sp. 1137 TaxID=1545835 RepID=UPI0009505129|nr:hypothetical protein [Marinitoga sp. 1137]APT75065.1 hypothetical protein LN42_00635 [Marinitoga sp. 1137]
MEIYINNNKKDLLILNGYIKTTFNSISEAQIDTTLDGEEFSIGDKVEIYNDENNKIYTGYISNKKDFYDRGLRRYNLKSGMFFWKDKPINELKTFYDINVSDIFNWLFSSISSIWADFTYELDVNLTDFDIAYIQFQQEDTYGKILERLQKSLAFDYFVDSEDKLIIKFGIAQNTYSNTFILTDDLMEDKIKIETKEEKYNDIIIEGKKYTEQVAKIPVWGYEGEVPPEGLPDGKDEEGNSLPNEEWFANLEAICKDLDKIEDIVIEGDSSGITLDATIYNSNFNSDGTLKYGNKLKLKINNSTGEKRKIKFKIYGRIYDEERITSEKDISIFIKRKLKITDNLIQKKSWAGKLVDYYLLSGKEKIIINGRIFDEYNVGDIVSYNIGGIKNFKVVEKKIEFLEGYAKYILEQDTTQLFNYDPSSSNFYAQLDANLKDAIISYEFNIWEKIKDYTTYKNEALCKVERFEQLELYDNKKIFGIILSEETPGSTWYIHLFLIDAATKTILQHENVLEYEIGAPFVFTPSEAFSKMPDVFGINGGTLGINIFGNAYSYNAYTNTLTKHTINPHQIERIIDYTTDCELSGVFTDGDGEMAFYCSKINQTIDSNNGTDFYKFDNGNMTWEYSTFPPGTQEYADYGRGLLDSYINLKSLVFLGSLYGGSIDRAFRGFNYYKDDTGQHLTEGEYVLFSSRPSPYIAIDKGTVQITLNDLGFNIYSSTPALEYIQYVYSQKVIYYGSNKFYPPDLKLESKITMDVGRYIAEIVYSWDNKWYLFYKNNKLNFLANGMLLKDLDIPSGQLDEIEGFISFLDRTYETNYPLEWDIYLRKGFDLYKFKLTDELLGMIGSRSIQEMVKDGTIVLPDKGRNAVSEPQEGQIVREGTNLYIYMGGVWKQFNIS